MLNSSVRALGRKQLAVIAVALAAFGGFVAYRTQAAADAHETKATMAMTCAIVGAMNVDYTLTHTPESGAIAGQTFTLNVKSSVSLPASTPDLPVSAMSLTIPIPEGVTSGGEIHVMSGSFTKASQAVEGANLVLNLTANAGTTTKNLVAPEMMIPMDIPADAAGKTIAFAGPSKLVTTADLAGAPFPAECTADAGNPPLVTTQVAAGSSPTTGGPTTSGPDTTAAPTTQGPATTVTTKAPATTATTSAPSTTTAVSGGDEEGEDEGDDTDLGVGGAPTPVVATPTYTG